MKYCPCMDDILHPSQWSAGSIYAPSAIDDKAAHTHCSITVPTVLLYSATEPVLAHPNGDTHEHMKITNLVEKWDKFQSLEVVSEGVVEGEKSEERVYSSRRVSQEFLKLQNVFEQKSREVQPTDEHSISLSNVSFSSISTNMKGAANNNSKIPRRYKSVQKHTSVGNSESESGVDKLSSTYLLSSSKMIDGRTLLAEPKAA